MSEEEKNKPLAVIATFVDTQEIEEVPRLENRIEYLERCVHEAEQETRRWKIAMSRAVTQSQLQNIIDIAAHIGNPDDPGDYGTPRTDDHYLHPKVGMRKCPCKRPGCDRFWLTGIGEFENAEEPSKFVGFTEQEARDVVEVMKTLPKYQLKMQNMNVAKRRE